MFIVAMENPNHSIGLILVQDEEVQPITGLLAPVRLGYIMSSAVYFATESNR